MADIKDHVKTTDLASYIFDNLHQGLNGDVIRYLLREDLKNVFGRSYVMDNEVAAQVTEEAITINSIFGINAKFYSTKPNNGLEIICEANEKEAFRIKDSNGIITNEITFASNNGFERYTYLINTLDGTYSFDVSKSLDGESYERIFDSKLIPLSNKMTFCDVFELITSNQKEEVPDSYLMRIVKSLVNDNMIKIPVDGTRDYNNYLSAIFERLKVEYHLLEKENKKMLQK